MHNESLPANKILLFRERYNFIVSTVSIISNKHYLIPISIKILESHLLIFS